jgi:hypothetical protein
MNAVSKARLERINQYNSIVSKICSTMEVTPAQVRKIQECKFLIKPAIDDKEIGEIATIYYDSIDPFLRFISLADDGEIDKAEVELNKAVELFERGAELSERIAGGD